ncbi:MAG: bifunctional biotin--[acetyl-CoA-carboxylase] ligase/biotin operon repressor BirA [Pseudomonas sp.]
MLTLLKLLQDGHFHSGQALGAALGISRSAVWKQLQHVEAELDLPVYKVRGRGYRLARPLVLLESACLVAGGKGPDWPVFIHDHLDSTSAQAFRLLGQGVEAPFLVLAERQTAGRGRRGRRWVSPFADNVYYSLVVRIEGGARQLEGLSLVVGLAVLQTLRQLGVARAGLKWPNDVLVAGRKMAGILLELSGDPADVCHVVIGIGINVNMQAVDEPIDQPWTSVMHELGDQVDRNALVRLLNAQLHDYLVRHRRSGFSTLQAEWEAAHVWQNRPVTLTAGSRQIKGVVLGINEQGALRLNVDNVEQQFSGGELSLRLRDDS